MAEAQAVRDKEQATFAASDEELTGDIDTLEHAIGILKKELAKSSRAFAQDDAKGCLQWWRPQDSLSMTTNVCLPLIQLQQDSCRLRVRGRWHR